MAARAVRAARVTRLLGLLLSTRVDTPPGAALHAGGGGGEGGLPSSETQPQFSAAQPGAMAVLLLREALLQDVWLAAFCVAAAEPSLLAMLAPALSSSSLTGSGGGGGECSSCPYGGAPGCALPTFVVRLVSLAFIAAVAFRLQTAIHRQASI